MGSFLESYVALGNTKSVLNTLAEFHSKFGVEIEFASPMGYEGVRDALRNVLGADQVHSHCGMYGGGRNGYSRWSVTSDSSINGGSYGIEVISPVFDAASDTCLTQLKAVFDCIRTTIGGVTNSSCGLHITMSCDGLSRNTFKPHVFCFLADDVRLLRQFRRDRNRYCESMVLKWADRYKTDVRAGLSNLSTPRSSLFGYGKYCSVNVGKLRPGSDPNSLVEYRGVGGDYLQSLSAEQVVGLARRLSASLVFTVSPSSDTSEAKKETLKFFHRAVTPVTPRRSRTVRTNRSFAFFDSRRLPCGTFATFHGCLYSTRRGEYGLKVHWRVRPIGQSSGFDTVPIKLHDILSAGSLPDIQIVSERDDSHASLSFVPPYLQHALWDFLVAVLAMKAPEFITRLSVGSSWLSTEPRKFLVVSKIRSDIRAVLPLINSASVMGTLRDLATERASQFLHVLHSIRKLKKVASLPDNILIPHPEAAYDPCLFMVTSSSLPTDIMPHILSDSKLMSLGDVALSLANTVLASQFDVLHRACLDGKQALIEHFTSLISHHRSGLFSDVMLFSGQALPSSQLGTYLDAAVTVVAARDAAVLPEGSALSFIRDTLLVNFRSLDFRRELFECVSIRAVAEVAALRADGTLVEHDVVRLYRLLSQFANRSLSPTTYANLQVSVSIPPSSTLTKAPSRTILDDGLAERASQISPMFDYLRSLWS